APEFGDEQAPGVINTDRLDLGVFGEGVGVFARRGRVGEHQRRSNALGQGARMNIQLAQFLRGERDLIEKADDQAKQQHEKRGEKGRSPVEGGVEKTGHGERRRTDTARASRRELKLRLLSDARASSI